MIGGISDAHGEIQGEDVSRCWRDLVGSAWESIEEISREEWKGTADRRNRPTFVDETKAAALLAVDFLTL